MKILISESQMIRLYEKYKVTNYERIKMFEDENFLFVIPLSHQASCKYGAKTTWCTSAKDDDMWSRHDSLGAAGYLMVKTPELQQKLGSEKFAFYLNAPSANYGKNFTPDRIIFYDELNNPIPNIIFLRMMDEVGEYNDFKTIADLFVEYTKNKFSPDNKQLLNQMIRNPF